MALTTGISDASAQGQGQAYPSRPLRIVVPYSGGSSDVAARLLAPRLSESLKQPVLVENRPGANGAIGTEYVSKANPDGHTLLSVLTTHAIGASLMTLPYDPIKDFAPVAAMSVAELGMAVHNGVPANTLQEFITHVKSLPQPLAYSTTQLGGNQHLAGELFTLITGAKMTPIPYKGGGDALAAVLGGHVQMYFGSMASLSPVIKSGKLRGLAVTGAKRDPDFPSMPTFAEGGVPGLEIRLWYGFLAPAATPRDIVNRLSGLIVGYVAQPDFKASLAKQGMDPMPLDAAQFSKFLRAEHASYASIIKRANIKVEP
ncbi:MAG: tripartite tricarboxylate transporter substrate binding protein [Proteobacteria bacterium]|nr:tripartite tricarboxylate transporter substrate binding protein [Burkholderiales bacterium]